MSLKRIPRRKPRNTEGSWAISYVDMLTLLLCFFIIFYNNSQSHGEENILNKIAYDLSGGPVAAGAGTGPGDIKGDGTAFGVNLWGKGLAEGRGNISISDEDRALLELIKAKLTSELPASIKTDEKSLEIDFEGISFFESGKTKLLPSAEVRIEKVINLLTRYKNLVRITVQGHTDPTKMRLNEVNVTDNWELSVLRATRVLKVFVKNGYSPQYLSAEGFADTRTNRTIAEFSKSDLAKLRKITLRIEPAQVKN